ncbi:MAG: M20/M25/M40 family metallo-hydrolase [Acidobacteriia bacterium]|nr:M20/M25/M40 family metallo-hydrolase [Terriglobia bacterium]
MAVVCIIALSSASLVLHAQKKAKQPAAGAGQSSIPAVQKPENVDLEFIIRLREEEFRHGKVMDIMSDLTDKIGPRLTGSPNMKKANEWTRDQLAQWGLATAHVEPWGTFGRGWAYQFCEVRMTSPDYMQFLALPNAWTPGTNGAVSGEPVHVIANNAEELDKYRGKLAGKIVLLGEARVPDPETPKPDPDQPPTPDARAEQARNPAPADKAFFRRYSDTDLEKIATYMIPGPPDARRQAIVRRYLLQRALDKFLAEEKPAAVLVPTRTPGQDGTIFVQSSGSHEKGKTITVPVVTVALEHYNRVVRLLNKKAPVTIEVNVQTQFYDDDDKGYNTVAEIPGADPKLKEQLVMLGGHMDSWHAGEGATDNGAGVAVAMEAVRLLKQLGVKPRRTIRIALWSGEEQGLLGSRGYVAEHFGSRPEPTDPKERELPRYLRREPPGPLTLKPEQKLVSGYFNYDNGTGKIRGIYVQENAAAVPIFKAWMEPFRDLGMTTISMRNTGGTDHLSFDAVGIPGFQFIQDPMDYDTLTHHSNLDVYEHIRPDDMKQAAVIMASFVYNAAMRDDMLPRKPIRPDEPKAESESGAEKKGEPAPPPSNPMNPAKPMPQEKQQETPKQ